MTQVKVKPNACSSALEQAAVGTWLAQLKSAAVASKANEELIVLVAKRFEWRGSALTTKSGAFGRMKLVHIEAA